MKHNKRCFLLVISTNNKNKNQLPMEQVKIYPKESIFLPELLLFNRFSHSVRCFLTTNYRKIFCFCRSSTSQTTHQWIVSKQQQSPWWRQKSVMNKEQRWVGSKRFKRKRSSQWKVLLKLSEWAQRRRDTSHWGDNDVKSAESYQPRRRLWFKKHIQAVPMMQMKYDGTSHPENIIECDGSMW